MNFGLEDRARENSTRTAAIFCTRRMQGRKGFSDGRHRMSSASIRAVHQLPSLGIFDYDTRKALSARTVPWPDRGGACGLALLIEMRCQGHSSRSRPARQCAKMPAGWRWATDFTHHFVQGSRVRDDRPASVGPGTRGGAPGHKRRGRCRSWGLNCGHRPAGKNGRTLYAWLGRKLAGLSGFSGSQGPNAGTRGCPKRVQRNETH